MYKYNIDLEQGLIQININEKVEAPDLLQLIGNLTSDPNYDSSFCILLKFAKYDNRISSEIRDNFLGFAAKEYRMYSKAPFAIVVDPADSDFWMERLDKVISPHIPVGLFCSNAEALSWIKQQKSSSNPKSM